MNITKISPFASSSFKVIVNSDTNNDFLQMINQNDTRQCMFPLVMDEPWSTLTITDFICNEHDINQTIDSLSKKFDAIK